MSIHKKFKESYGRINYEKFFSKTLFSNSLDRIFNDLLAYLCCLICNQSKRRTLTNQFNRINSKHNRLADKVDLYWKW